MVAGQKHRTENMMPEGINLQYRQDLRLFHACYQFDINTNTTVLLDTNLCLNVVCKIIMVTMTPSWDSGFVGLLDLISQSHLPKKTNRLSSFISGNVYVIIVKLCAYILVS